MLIIKPKIVFPILLTVFVISDPLFSGEIITVGGNSADYITIQAAIDAAADGDSILVSDGTYTGDGNRDIDFLGKAITVKSENGPEHCIIDCNGSKEDPHRGFNFYNNEKESSVLDGFTITNGYAAVSGGGIQCALAEPVITNCIITGNFAEIDGGGIWGSRGLISNCIISENSAISDVEWYGFGGGLRFCDGTIINCTISNNIASYIGGGLEWCSGSIISCTIRNNSSGYNGGGIHRCYGSIADCLIEDNSTIQLGGGLCGVGTVSRCIIRGNSAGAWGGGLFGCEGAINNCIFIENSAANGGGLADCQVPITSCNFINNIAIKKGGAIIYCDNLITNCIFVNNTNQAIYENPYAYISKTYSPIVKYSLFYNNPDGDWYDYETSAVFTGSEEINQFTEGGYNIDVNPLFESSSYRLQSGSRCINAGDPDCEINPGDTDIDGLPRINGCRIDIGAHEYECDPAIPILVVQEKSLKFTSRENEANPSPQTLSIHNCNNSTLNWYLKSDVSWIKTNVTSGVSKSEINYINIEINTQELSHGIHTGLLAICNEQDITDIKYVPVTLELLGTLHVPEQYPTIQSAIDDSLNGDIIVVADGTYTGEGNRDIDFLGKTITVMSANGPDNCVINCEGTEEDPHRGLYFHNNEMSDSILNGFTITKGHASSGGGILCELSSPTITNCIIVGNAAISHDSSSLTFGLNWGLTNCGGGIYCVESKVSISKCTFTRNTAGLKGAGIYCNNSDGSILTNCLITNNRIVKLPQSPMSGMPSLSILKLPSLLMNDVCSGGGIYCTGETFIRNTVIAGNSADKGAGIYCGNNTFINNSTIYNNIANNSGGGIYCWLTVALPESSLQDSVNNTSCNISNCIIRENQAKQGSQLAIDGSRMFSMEYSLSTSVSRQPREVKYKNLFISYCNIQAGKEGLYIGEDYTIENAPIIWGQGNIDIDPMFVNCGYWDTNETLVDPNDDILVDCDLRLLWDSPCINAGDPDYVPEVYEVDLDGNKRIAGNRIDMGAYESDPVNAQLWISPKTIQCQNQRMENIVAWFRLPEGVTKEQIDSKELLILYPKDSWEGVEAIHQVVIKPGRAEKQRINVIAIFDKTEIINAITGNGKIELEVVGKLKTGQYFYGTDTITVINPGKWPRPWHQSWYDHKWDRRYRQSHEGQH